MPRSPSPSSSSESSSSSSNEESSPPRPNHKEETRKFNERDERNHRDERKRGRSPSSPRRYHGAKSEKKARREKNERGRRSPSPENMEYGKPGMNDEKKEKDDKRKKIDDKDKEKPDFGLSGKLSEEQRTTVDGTILKFLEPAEARKPTKKWKLYPFKGDQALEPIPVHTASAYLFGRDRNVADIPTDHPSCSKQHAVLQFRQIETPNERTGETKKEVKPYLIDLESTNGSFINGEKIQESRYYELKPKDCLKFGFSSREYVIMYEEMV